MRLRSGNLWASARQSFLGFFCRQSLILLLLACPAVALAQAHETPTPQAGGASAVSSPMSSASWLAIIAMKLENEAMSDLKMLPDAPSALEREWRSFDSNGSALGALANVGWVALMACVCVAAERGVEKVWSRRARRRMRMQANGPSFACLMTALVCDAACVLVFVALFVYGRHAL